MLLGAELRLSLIHEMWPRWEQIKKGCSLWNSPSLAVSVYTGMSLEPNGLCAVSNGWCVSFLHLRHHGGQNSFLQPFIIDRLGDVVVGAEDLGFPASQGAMPLIVHEYWN